MSGETGCRSVLKRRRCAENGDCWSLAAAHNHKTSKSAVGAQDPSSPHSDSENRGSLGARANSGNGPAAQAAANTPLVDEVGTSATKQVEFTLAPPQQVIPPGRKGTRMSSSSYVLQLLPRQLQAPFWSPMLNLNLQAANGIVPSPHPRQFTLNPNVSSESSILRWNSGSSLARLPVLVVKGGFSGGEHATVPFEGSCRLPLPIHFPILTLGGVSAVCPIGLLTGFKSGPHPNVSGTVNGRRELPSCVPRCNDVDA
jgi:hypothetical protein